MALRREEEENPYVPPLSEDYLKTAWQYRDQFDTEEEFQEALQQWPKCPRCGRRRITRCPICKTSGDLFPLAAQDYFDPTLPSKPEEPARATSSCSGSCSRSCREEEYEDADFEETPEVLDERRQSRLHAWAELSNSAARSDGSPPALLCNVCSEAFTPVFPRFCEWCDYDFGSGEEYAVDGSVSSEVDEFLARKNAEEQACYEPNPERLLWTVAALLGGLAIFLAYWVVILQ